MERPSVNNFNEFVLVCCLDRSCFDPSRIVLRICVRGSLRMIVWAVPSRKIDSGGTMQLYLDRLFSMLGRSGFGRNCVKTTAIFVHSPFISVILVVIVVVVVV